MASYPITCWKGSDICHSRASDLGCILKLQVQAILLVQSVLSNISFVTLKEGVDNTMAEPAAETLDVRDMAPLEWIIRIQKIKAES
jgi:hypothetical protein